MELHTTVERSDRLDIYLFRRVPCRDGCGPQKFDLKLRNGQQLDQRRQLEALDYVKEENWLLKERLDGRRLRFTDAERHRSQSMRLGRMALSELDTLVTPDTLMRWYRTLVAQKWTYTHRRGPGRARRSHGAGESILGLYENSGRAGELRA